MNSYLLNVENIKCMGCVNNIRENLLQMEGVVSVDADIKTQKVSVSGIAIDRDAIASKLAQLGYPEKGKNSFLDKAKTYISCKLQELTKK